MPSVSQLNVKMEAWAQDWANTETGRITYYQRVIENRPRVEKEPNFDNLLSDMHSLINSFACEGTEFSPPSAPDPVSMRFRTADAFADLNLNPNIGPVENHRSRIIDQVNFYVRRGEFFRAAYIEFGGSDLEKARHPFQIYRWFFENFREHFDVGITP